jgi:hypothetical protein
MQQDTLNYVQLPDVVRSHGIGIGMGKTTQLGENSYGRYLFQFFYIQLIVRKIISTISPTVERRHYLYIQLKESRD